MCEKPGGKQRDRFFLMTFDLHPTTQRGLTLLEMMVVLLIASMAITLGFQSLGQWRRANAVISSISGATQQSMLTESWLENSLRSLIPLEDAPFEGTAEQLQGIAVQPVQSHQGGATSVKWSVSQDTEGGRQLLLDEDGRQLSLPLPGIQRASFEYVDKEGRSYSQWPPKLGLHDHLPMSIVLKQEMDDGSVRLWTSTIAGTRNPLFNPFEVDFDN